MTKEEYLNSDYVKMAHLNNQVVYLTQVNRRLEKENQQLKQQNEQLEKQIKDLESQLKYVIEDNDYYQKENEKMKCCGNCKHFDCNEPNYCHKGVYRERQYVCNKWELAE